jgi:hypothetical protein
VEIDTFGRVNLRGNSKIETTGVYSYAINCRLLLDGKSQRLNNPYITISDSEIKTSGEWTHAIITCADVEVKGRSKVETAGDGCRTISAIGCAAVSDDSEVRALGNDSIALFVGALWRNYFDSIITVSDNAKVETAGNNSFTIIADAFDSAVVIEGGEVIATGNDSIAICPGNDISVNGGVVLGTSSDLTDVICHHETTGPFSGPTGNGLVIAYNKGEITTYDYGSTDDLITWPVSASVSWARSGDCSGVKYANESNTGFIVIPGVTVIGKQQGANVLGRIKSYNPDKSTTIRLMKEEESLFSTTIYGEGGSGQKEQDFTLIGVAPGEYDLVIEKDLHSKFTVKKLVVGDEDIDLTGDIRPEVRLMTLRCGDINGDGLINDADLTVLWRVGNYNRKTGEAENERCDLNGDGLINDADLTILWQAYNYNRGAIVIDY